jgi:hypothetical protein
MVLSGKEPRTRFIDFYCWLWASTAPSAASPITGF